MELTLVIPFEYAFPGDIVRYAAATTALRQSTHGSRIPYPSREIAFEGTPNFGSARVADDGRIHVRLQTQPAAFIHHNEFVPPAVFVDTSGAILQYDISFPEMSRTGCITSTQTQGTLSTRTVQQGRELSASDAFRCRAELARLPFESPSKEFLLTHL